jgi:C1A family cysteine protease
MNIYTNTTGDCTGLAIATAINNRFGITIPKEEVDAFYERHDWTERGARMINALTVLKEEDNLGGYKVKSYKLVFFDGSSKNPALEVRKAMGHKHTDLLMSMWLRTRNNRGDLIPLDKNFYYKPNNKAFRSTHSLFVIDYDFMEEKHVPLGVRIANNWGKDWGEYGYFYMTFPQMQTEVCQLFEVEFEKV